MEEALVRARTRGLGTAVQGREMSQASPSNFYATPAFAFNPFSSIPTGLTFPTFLSTNLPSLFPRSHSFRGLYHPVVSFRPQPDWVFTPQNHLFKPNPTQIPAASSTHRWHGLSLHCSEATMSLHRPLLCVLDYSPLPPGRKMR